jgi:hypothetical protein
MNGWANVQLPAGSLPLGQWFHLVFTFDGANTGDMAIYTNGVLASNVPAANTAYSPVSVPFAIGSGYANMQGHIDDVAVYQTVLAPADVLAHYQAGTNGLGGYVAAVQANSPVGFWRLNDTVPLLPVDVASNVVNASLNGAYRNNPKHQLPGALVASSDKASAFDANNNLMQVPYSATLNSSNFTAEAWLEPTAVQAPGDINVCAMASVFASSPREGWLIYQNSAGFEFRTYNQNGTTPAVDITGGPVIRPYTWYHVAVSWNGTVGKLYVNGALAATSASTTYVPNTSAAFTVGGRSDSSFFWGGVAQEVALYSSNLTDAQILAHYQNGINASPSQTYASLIEADGAISYWPLSEPNYDTTIYEPNLGTLGKLGDGRFLYPFSTDTNGEASGTPGPIITDPTNEQVATIFGSGSSAISIPLNDVFTRTNVFSFEEWYFDDNSSFACPAWWRDEPNTGDTRGWVWYEVPNNFWQVSSTVNTWDGFGDELNVSSDNLWQQVDFTWDGTNALIYVNGVLCAENGAANFQYVKLVDRGVQTIGNAQYQLTGEIAEVSYYTNLLTPDRVQAHWTAATGTLPPPVLANISGAGLTPTTPLPSSVAVSVGASVTVPAYILGTEPFTNQWWTATAGGVATAPAAGQTNATLSFPSATTNDAGNYVLIVDDSAGSVTSSVVNVSIESSPATVVASPVSVTRIEGISVTLDVTASGSEPIHYQWLSNGVAISGATSSSLTLSDIQPSFATNYRVTVFNTLGTNTSSPATLTVIPEATGSYASTVAADAPVAYWRLDETNGATTAADIAGGHDGTYSGSETLGQPGAILGDPDTSVYFPDAGGIQIPFSTDLNPPETFSVEFWARGDTNGANSDRMLFSSRTYFSGWNYGYQILANANNTWQFAIGEKTSGTLSITSDVTNAADGLWHYVVATFNNNTVDMSLYVDGQLVATGSPATSGLFAPNADYTSTGNAPAADQAIGSTSDNDPQGALLDPYYGGIDEVAIYNYALSPAQITSHFTVGGPPTLGVVKSSGNEVVVTWTKGELLEATNLLGPWTTNTTATSPLTLTNTPAGSTKFFRTVLP